MDDPRIIVYACDDNYAGLTAVSAVSLLKHNPRAHIHLLGCALKPESLELVRSRVEAHGGSFTYLDASAPIARLKAEGVTSYVSYAVYARIFIPELMPETDGRILYLDCDTLVVDSLDALFARDLHGRPLALGLDAAPPAYKRVIKISPDKPYYNSGVMLTDLSAWRNARCTERILDELRHPQGPNPLGDQDIIVRALNDDIDPLEARWNFLSQFILLGCQDRPAIYHFSGNTLGRPWFTSSRHPLRSAYVAAANEAALPELANQRRPMSVEYRVQYVLYRLLPRPLFLLAYRLMGRAFIWKTYGV